MEIIYECTHIEDDDDNDDVKRINNNKAAVNTKCQSRLNIHSFPSAVYI